MPVASLTTTLLSMAVGILLATAVLAMRELLHMMNASGNFAGGGNEDVCRHLALPHCRRRRRHSPQRGIKQPESCVGPSRCDNACGIGPTQCPCRTCPCALPMLGRCQMSASPRRVGPGGCDSDHGACARFRCGHPSGSVIADSGICIAINGSVCDAWSFGT